MGQKLKDRTETFLLVDLNHDAIIIEKGSKKVSAIKQSGNSLVGRITLLLNYSDFGLLRKENYFVSFCDCSFQAFQQNSNNEKVRNSENLFQYWKSLSENAMKETKENKFSLFPESG